ncbi:hypothetical protein [Stappia sp. ES.058]|uniref:hypothetical protein n=1 Tax=Stappia sp. ES.058 TaxID=1881061 RepID=UPI00087CA500|nr:hypothetical protein [Stappia sp. ES.058]SDT97235.1 hypothetical protein SAMN05428979_0823 [Stappia sp. ES.058]
MVTADEILSKLNGMLGGISATLDAAGASKVITLDRTTGADAALVKLREGGNDRFRWGLPPGENDFVIQYSPDDSPLSFADRFRIDGATGRVTVTGLALDDASFAKTTFTGQSLFDPGSAAAPALASVGNVDTGLFFPAADTIAAAVDGTEIWRTTAAGVDVDGTISATALDLTGGLSTTGNFEASSAASKGTIGRSGWAGNYSASKVQGVWAIGDQYRVDLVANNFGSQFGLVYAYTSAGNGVASKLPIAGWGHQILIASTGVPLIGFSMTYGHAWFSGNVGIGPSKTDPAHRLDVEGTVASTGLIIDDDSIQLTTAKTPSSAADIGTTGEIAWDADFIYVCTAADTWKRAALATW